MGSPTTRTPARRGAGPGRAVIPTCAYAPPTPTLRGPRLPRIPLLPALEDIPGQNELSSPFVGGFYVRCVLDCVYCGVVGGGRFFIFWHGIAASTGKNLADDLGLCKVDEKQGMGYGRERRKRSTEGGGMEAELQSCWAGRETRSRAEESAVGNKSCWRKWALLGGAGC